MRRPAGPAPRGTRAVVETMMTALATLPQARRKLAFLHAAAEVENRLIAEAEVAKAASRRAPARPRGAKMAAAEAATRLRRRTG
jgi:hypothetical protein